MIRVPTTTVTLADGRVLQSRWMTKQDAAFVKATLTGSGLTAPDNWDREIEKCVQRNKDAGQRIFTNGVLTTETYCISTVVFLDGTRVAFAQADFADAAAQNPVLAIAAAHRGKGLAAPIMRLGHYQTYTDMKCTETRSAVLHDVPAGRQAALNTGLRTEGTTFAAGGRLAHKGVHKPAYAPAGTALKCTTTWSDYADDDAKFARRAAPDIREGLRATDDG